MSLYNSLIESILDSDIEISAERINKICIDKNILNESRICSLPLIEATVSKELGINSTVFNKEVSKAASKSADLIRKEGLNQKCRSQILQNIKDMYDNIQHSIDFVIFGGNPKVQQAVKKFGQENISRSIALVLGILIINTFADRFLTLLFGPAGGYLTGVLVAPLTEESAKQIAIRNNYSEAFIVVFNIFEFTLYMSNPYFVSVVGFERLFKIRIVAVLSHVSYNVVQLIFSKPEIQKKLGVDKDDPDSVEKCKLTGQLIAMILHSSWNTGILSSLVLGALGLI